MLYNDTDRRPPDRSPAVVPGPMNRHRYRSLRPALAAMACGILIQAIDGMAQAPRTDPFRVPAASSRRVADPPPPSPPALPPEALEVTPLTLELRITSGPGAFRTETIARTVDRVHVKENEAREWLFVRNPVDVRRVSAYLVEHSERTIVVHDESDLRHEMGMRGWLDVLTMGLDPGAVADLEPTAEPKQVDSGAGLVTIQRILAGVDPQVVRLPQDRFPAYRVIDRAELLEDRERRQR
jgi:hypothetical protein